MSGLNAVASVWNHLVSGSLLVCLSACLVFHCALAELGEAWVHLAIRVCPKPKIAIMKSLSVYMTSLMKTECLWAAHQSRWYEPHCHLTVILLAFISSWNGYNAPLGWQTERRTQKADNSWEKVNDRGEEWVMIALPLIKSRQAHSHKAHFLLSVYLKTHRPVWK